MQQPPQSVELPWPDRVARFALRIILADIIVSVAMGLMVALAWGIRPDSPLLHDLGGGLGGGRGIPAAGFLVALMLGFPSLSRGLRDVAGRRWSEAGRLLAFAGPLLIFVGFAYLPHGLDPCGGWLEEGSRLGDQLLCEPFEDTLEVHTRFHLLYHALVPTALLVGLYWMALRRWHRAITRQG